MALVKVAGVIFMRDLIKSRGEAVVNGYLKTLTQEDRNIYQNLLPINKLPIEQITRFYELAMPLLFPDKPLAEGLWQLGYQNAENDMKGLYRFILRVFSLETVIKQAAAIWKLYHEKGEASVQRVSAKNIKFLVKNYPEIPKSFREQLSGYISGLISLTGAKGIEVVRNDANPNAWEWVITVE